MSCVPVATVGSNTTFEWKNTELAYLKLRVTISENVSISCKFNENRTFRWAVKEQFRFYDHFPTSKIFKTSFSRFSRCIIHCPFSICFKSADKMRKTIAPSLFITSECNQLPCSKCFSLELCSRLLCNHNCDGQLPEYHQAEDSQKSFQLLDNVQLEFHLCLANVQMNYPYISRHRSLLLVFQLQHHSNVTSFLLQ